MMRRAVLDVFMTLVLLAVTVAVAFAQGNSQSTFSISPPPIATPVFETKETDVKLGGTYLTMKSTDPGTDFKLSGGGLNIAGRSAFGNMFALDYAAGFMYMTGDISLGTGTTGTTGAASKLDLNAASIPLSVGIEVQPYRNDVFNIILFAGPTLNLTMATIDNVPTPTFTGTSVTVVNDSITSTSVLYGIQGGAQVGVGLGDFHVDVFGMVTNLRGTQDSESTFGGSTSSDIPAYTTTSYGADIAYVPWGLALSSILQEAQQGDNNGTKTSMYSLSWSRKF